MRTITKKRAQEIFLGNGPEPTASEERELARIALASLEAEPVAYSLIFRNMDGVLNDYVNANTTFSTIEKAQAYGRGGNYVEQNDGSLQWVSDPSLDPVVVPLYTAPPAPVSDSLLSELLGIAKRAADEADECAHSEFSDDSLEHSAAIADWERRAAMLQGADGTLTNEGTIPVTQFKPVADLYGLTSPTGGETSFTFDAVEARDFIDGGWSCQEYVELGRFQEAMLQNGNSPAQSDCCPEQNYIAPAQDGDYPVIPDGWIPVSERMPGSQEWVIVFAKWDNQQVLCWDDVANRWTDFEDQSYYADMFTHWMPLPAAPQQEA
ncbi:DUF551 domain-containing protein [Enterobacter hormaechei]|uniref:DUF551 domain-containing protein n=1 Tax=Enterobacter hormaechei TaxID=158836 RepID=UPI001AE5DEDB|nr:DUF551 domain-containing protein [Enterobacter hormaechei]MBP0990918.1 DUF551 domain-containing protein [Enterobacter hormaechei]MBP1020250.1 DUF551 domain-containing protein [Enterobacter hormaechei]MBP1024779.1 DUF551 domain-containing protein [Enterobacter hormaechei]